LALREALLLAGRPRWWAEARPAHAVCCKGVKGGTRETQA